jgi:hypothetical protein
MKKHKHNSRVKIDHDVPMPQSIHKYPWDEMKIGDSFLAPVKSLGSMASLCSRKKAEKGWQYRLRQTPEGIRVWRVA